ncbi:MAG: hypothetical protein A4E69_02269 [Syntrophus sp. PtaB.Bin138]|nr:MAG: hypothetical protein A4E69_02269 [Syntrophus sp. PtaB.Bin138]
MRLHDMKRNKRFLLLSVILAVFVCFVMQGVFAAYASACPETDSYISLLKDHGARSSPKLKKPVKLLAVPGCTITFDPRTCSSSISRPCSTFTTVIFHSTDPARAPPAPFFRQIL